MATQETTKETALEREAGEVTQGTVEEKAEGTTEQPSKKQEEASNEKANDEDRVMTKEDSEAPVDNNPPTEENATRADSTEEAQKEETTQLTSEEETTDHQPVTGRDDGNDQKHAERTREPDSSEKTKNGKEATPPASTEKETPATQESRDDADTSQPTTIVMDTAQPDKVTADSNQPSTADTTPGIVADIAAVNEQAQVAAGSPAQQQSAAESQQAGLLSDPDKSTSTRSVADTSTALPETPSVASRQQEEELSASATSSTQQPEADDAAEVKQSPSKRQVGLTIEITHIGTKVAAHAPARARIHSHTNTFTHTDQCPHS